MAWCWINQAVSLKPPTREGNTLLGSDLSPLKCDRSNEVRAIMLRLDQEHVWMLAHRDGLTQRPLIERLMQDMVRSNPNRASLSNVHWISRP
jgi:hypothetical protein